MNFNTHSNLEGCHAFLGASKYHWVNYDDERLVEAYTAHTAKIRGTRLHEFAKECIELRQRLPKTKATLNMYVNDAIGFRMTPEQPLFYSINCFGTTDTICFDNSLLRIHDLKNGVVPASPRQLEIYAALFCLEYRIDPNTISFELRIYQSSEVFIFKPGGQDIKKIMDKIVYCDKIINTLIAGE